MNELIAAFDEYFRLVAADSPQLLHEVFRLRYEIYCEETHLCDRSLFPKQLESDGYDRRSVHILLQHRLSGYYVGTVRLVLPDPANLEEPFPTEELAPFDRGFAGVPRELRRHAAEISRLAMLSRFPHHQARRTPRYSAPGAVDKEYVRSCLRFPQPLLALAVGIVHLSVEHDITHWYAIMTPSLDRLLSHFSLHLRVVGPAFDLYGRRRAHFDSVKNVLDKAYCRYPEVWELITDRGRLFPAPSRPEGVVANGDT